jgi:endonuclease/exonuclease/phosphatase (EEP) superfamily protein YafD
VQIAERGPFAVERAGVARRSSRLLRWVLTLALLGLCAGALGYLVHDEMQANDQTARTQSSLHVVREQTAPVSQQLADARRELSLVSTQVGSDSTALAQDVSQLKAAQSALAAARSHVSQQSSQIGVLHACLRGVEQALNALAIKKRARAVVALNAVSASCQAVSGG